MHLRPPVEMARCRLIAQLHEWINTVTGLPRIQSSRYQVTGWLKGRLPVYSYRILALLSHAPTSPHLLPVLSFFSILSLSSLLPVTFLSSLFPSFFPLLPPPLLFSLLSRSISPLPSLLSSSFLPLSFTQLGWSG